jgi:short-subunit dehydrogenase
MKPMDFRSRWVLVTGASSGLGKALAEQLAREHGANLVLVARRRNLLDELKKELEASGIRVETIAADLSRGEDVERVFEEAVRGREIYGAILNAGVTHFGDYHELSWEGFQTMLATNVTSVVRLATLFVPHLEQHDLGGGLLIVSSMSGLTPVPYQTAYSATKAFLVNFGCGLHHEVDGKNLSVTTFAPGGIQTEMTSGDRFRALGGWLMPVDRCARLGIESFRDRSYLNVPGVTMRVGTVLMKMLPQRFLTSRVAATYRTALRKSSRNA